MESECPDENLLMCRWCDLTHFAHARRHFFAWCGPFMVRQQCYKNDCIVFDGIQLSNDKDRLAKILAINSFTPFLYKAHRIKMNATCVLRPILHNMYLLSVLGQTGLSNLFRPRSDTGDCGVWSGSKLSHIQQFLEASTGCKMDVFQIKDRYDKEVIKVSEYS